MGLQQFGGEIASDINVNDVLVGQKAGCILEFTKLHIRCFVAASDGLAHNEFGRQAGSAVRPCALHSASKRLLEDLVKLAGEVAGRLVFRYTAQEAVRIVQHCVGYVRIHAGVTQVIFCNSLSP